MVEGMVSNLIKMRLLILLLFFQLGIGCAIFQSKETKLQLTVLGEVVDSLNYHSLIDTSNVLDVDYLINRGGHDIRKKSNMVDCINFHLWDLNTTDDEYTTSKKSFSTLFELKSNHTYFAASYFDFTNSWILTRRVYTVLDSSRIFNLFMFKILFDSIRIIL
jgi:hypothetical protein